MRLNKPAVWDPLPNFSDTLWNTEVDIHHQFLNLSGPRTWSLVHLSKWHPTNVSWTRFSSVGKKLFLPVAYNITIVRVGVVMLLCPPHTSRHHRGSQHSHSRLGVHTLRRGQGGRGISSQPTIGLCAILCCLLSPFSWKISPSFPINMVSSLEISCFLSYRIYRKKIAMMKTPLQDQTNSVLLQSYRWLSSGNPIAMEVYLRNSEVVFRHETSCYHCQHFKQLCSLSGAEVVIKIQQPEIVVKF